MRNFKDESFIAQYLSPKVIRDMKLFAMLDDSDNSELVISAIHDELGYQKIRQALSEQYNVSTIEPNIHIYAVNQLGDRTLILRHIQYQNRSLNNDVNSMMKYLHQLWGFNVKLESVHEDGIIVKTYQWPS